MNTTKIRLCYRLETDANPLQLQNRTGFGRSQVPKLRDQMQECYGPGPGTRPTQPDCPTTPAEVSGLRTEISHGTHAPDQVYHVMIPLLHL